MARIETTTRKVRKNRPRRASATTRVKRRKATRTNNKRSIVSNALRLSRLERINQRHKTYSDWYQAGIGKSAYNNPYVSLWECIPLIAPASWKPWGRQNSMNTNEQSTYLSYMNLRMYFTLPATSVDQTWNVFVVQLRKEFSKTYLPVLMSSGVWQNEEYYLIPNDPSAPTPPPVTPNTRTCNVQLNPGVFKVLKRFNFSLANDRIAYDPTGTFTPGSTGNPRSTYRNIQCTLPVKQKLKAMVGTTAVEQSWRSLGAASIPYYNQYYIVTVQQNSQSANAQFDWDLTCTSVSTD